MVDVAVPWLCRFLTLQLDVTRCECRLMFSHMGQQEASSRSRRRRLSLPRLRGKI